jgi:hypothetical protein
MKYIFKFITKLKKNVFSILSSGANYCNTVFLEDLAQQRRMIARSTSFSKKIGYWKFTNVSEDLLLSCVRKSIPENVGNMI